MQTAANKIMLCQHCNKNHATHHFIVSRNGQSSEIHLCTKCAKHLGKEYQGLLLHPWQLMGGWMPPFVQTNYPNIQQDSESEFRRRRKLGEMQARLETAIEEENYELAAKLRDEIAREQKEAPHKDTSSL